MGIACWIRNAMITDTQVMQHSLLFHCNNGCTNAPQCSVIPTLPVFLQAGNNTGIQGKNYSNFLSWLNVQLWRCLWNLTPDLIYFLYGLWPSFFREWIVVSRNVLRYTTTLAPYVHRVQYSFQKETRHIFVWNVPARHPLFCITHACRHSDEFFARDASSKGFVVKLCYVQSSVLQLNTYSVGGHAVAQSVEALRYKPEGRGFDSEWCHWSFSLT